MTTHTVKCWPEYFALLASGVKRFDVRKNDRHYQAGDTLVLQEFTPGEGYTYLDKDGKPTKELTLRITYVLTDFAGIEPGYCVLALENV